MASFAAVVGFLRLLTRIDPPEVRIQVTMQVVGAVLETSRLYVFDLSDICVARLLQLFHSQPLGVSPALPPLALTLTSRQLVGTFDAMNAPLAHPTTQEGFMEVILLFCKYVLILRLADHVDLVAFFSFVINPRLPEGECGQEWYFLYCLMVMCLQAM